MKTKKDTELLQAVNKIRDLTKEVRRLGESYVTKQEAATRAHELLNTTRAALDRAKNDYWDLVEGRE